MSSRCQCRFSGTADTLLGSHREPITSEKCWLDFAVRELSRVAAGKGRGQEAVWRATCKPSWWDSSCPHPWKNPTANPKDSKDALKTKFECLVKHLREEKKLPNEMQEEISLWEDGRTAEVFLMTSFSSMLSQVSNLHANLQVTSDKMRETGVNVQACILDDLQDCLNACLGQISNMRLIMHSGSSSTGVSDDGNLTAANKSHDHRSRLKRQHGNSKSDTDSQPQIKNLKQSLSETSHVSPPPSSSSSSVKSLSVSAPFNLLHTGPSSTVQQKHVLNLLKKRLLGEVKIETCVSIPFGTSDLKPKNIQEVTKAPYAVDSVSSSDSQLLSFCASDSIVPNLRPSSLLTDYPDLFELDFEEVSDVNILGCDFSDDLLARSSVCPDLDIENYSNQPILAAVTDSKAIHFDPALPFALCHHSDNSGPSSYAPESETDSEKSQTSEIDKLLCEQEEIEDVIACESGYSSEGSVSLRSSVDSDFSLHNSSDSLEIFMDSLIN